MVQAQIQIFYKRTLSAQNLPRIPSQPEIMIIRHPFITKEMYRRFHNRQFISTLENCSPLVNFIKHCNIKHLRPGPNGGADQIPVEFSLLAWNLVQGTFPASLLPHE